MDSEYLATCMYKAACKKVKDFRIWEGYMNRLEAIAGEMSPTHLGYCLYSIGKVQVPSVPRKFWNTVLPHVERAVPEMTSNGLMATLWTLRRAVYRPDDYLLERIAERVMENPSKFRPSDFISICNNLGFYGFRKNDSKFRDRFSAVARAQFESEIFAQDFRAAVDPLAIMNLWNDEMKGYILNRFRQIVVTARPNHLLKAYHSAVAVRVLAPGAWYSQLDGKTRGFYTRLAMRHIPTPGRRMDKFHTQVSGTLASDGLKLSHRNMFRWGPFFIDIGFEDEEPSSEDFSDDRKRCIILDKQFSFHSNVMRQYTELTKLEHELLSSLGWKVYHVNYKLWKRAKKGDRAELLRKVLAVEPKDKLPDRF
jgi:hypothetical protein